MGMTLKAMVIDPKDNVANLVGPGNQGADVICDIAEGQNTEQVQLQDELPSNHKFALRDIAAGEQIIKYGLVIGVSNQAIKQGQHVHAHNIDSNRGRGDKQT
jgi:altronate dehydratase small subunit